MYNMNFVKDYNNGGAYVMKLARKAEKANCKIISTEEPISYSLNNMHITSLDTHYERNTCDGTKMHRLWALTLIAKKPRKLIFNSFQAMKEARDLILHKQGFEK